MNEYPLYPELSEAGKIEAELLIQSFKSKLQKATESVIQNLYSDLMPYIESDSWSNFRNQIMEGFKNYGNRKIQAEYDFKAIRQEIYKEYREDIINDLNQDIYKENEVLKKQIIDLRELNRLSNFPF